MTLQEAKDQIAIENNFKSWDDIENTYCQTSAGVRQLFNWTDEAAELYAKNSYNQGIEDAANAARTTSYLNGIYDEWMTHVDKASIRNLKKP